MYLEVMTVSLSSVERILYHLKMEETRLRMNHSVTVLDKSILIYFLFLFVAIVGFINSYVNVQMLYLLVICGMFVLIIGLLPYVRTAVEESGQLERMIADLERRKNKEHR